MQGTLLVVLFAVVTCTVLSNPVDLFLPAVFVEAPRAELEEYRLSDDIWPSHYDVELTPYFEEEEQHEAFTFDGSVSINLKPSKAGLTKIALHKASINISSLTLIRVSNSAIVSTGLTIYNEETEILTIPVDEPLDVIDYLLKINYVGVLSDDMRGFYRSYYKVGGKTVWLASTQFQTTSARRAFPCFDEPKFKATFQIRINRPQKFRTFSNTEIKSETDLT